MLWVMQDLTFSPLSSSAYEIKTSKSGNEYEECLSFKKVTSAFTGRNLINNFSNYTHYFSLVVQRKYVFQWYVSR